jgi:hypothetical protein
VVPEERSVSGPRRPTLRPATERELVEAVALELGARGYRTYVDPDGTDYFDLAVRRGEEVGLVEGKLGGPSRVLAQALRRRAWADWVAVAVASERTAVALVARTAGTRAAVVGVWSWAAGRAREVRAPLVPPAGTPDPFSATRARFRQQLLDLDRGELPAGVRWSSVPAEVRRRSFGRGYSEWRLDETGPG